MIRVEVFLAILVLSIFAGCFGPEPGDSDDAGTDSAGALPTDTHGPDGNVTGPPVLFEAEDPWLANETERILFDGTVPGVEPYVGGCIASVPLDEDAFIPRGTKELRVQADATEALVLGSYHFDILSRGGRWNGDAPEENSADPVAEWFRPMGPIDWELEEEGSVASMSFECSHQGGAHHMDGPIKATITAVRDLDWEHAPIPDPWESFANETLVQEGVLTLVDVEMTWGSGDVANTMGPRLGSKEAELDLPVPLGTAYVAVAATWQMPGCRVDNCEMNTYFEHGGEWWDGYDAEADFDGATYLISWFAVPEFVKPPLPGAEEDTWAVVGLLPSSCDPYGNDCFLAYEGEATGRVLVEAWRADVDVDAIKARLGV